MQSCQHDWDVLGASLPAPLQPAPFKPKTVGPTSLGGNSRRSMPQFVYDRVERGFLGRVKLRSRRLPAPGPAMRATLPPGLPQPSVPEQSLPPLQPGPVQAEVEQLWSRVAAPAAPYELRQHAAHGLAAKLCAAAQDVDMTEHIEGTLRRCGYLTAPLLRLAREAEQRADVLTLQLVLSCLANFSFAGLSASLVSQDRGPLGALLVGALRASAADVVMRRYALAATYNLSSEGAVLDAIEAGGAASVLRHLATTAPDGPCRSRARQVLVNLKRRRSLVRAAAHSRVARRRLGCCGLCGLAASFDEIELDLEIEEPDEIHREVVESDGLPRDRRGRPAERRKSGAQTSGAQTSGTRAGSAPPTASGERGLARAQSSEQRRSPPVTTSSSRDDPPTSPHHPVPAPAESPPSRQLRSSTRDEGSVIAQGAGGVAGPAPVLEPLDPDRVVAHLAAARESLSVSLDEERAEEEIASINKLAAARAGGRE